MFYDIFSKLCEGKGISPSVAAQDIGIGKSNVSKWKSRGLTPRGEALNKIADYFGVSTDYLLTGEEQKEKAPPAMTTEEAVIAYFRADKGRDPTEEELRMFLSFTKPVLDSLPDKAD